MDEKKQKFIQSLKDYAPVFSDPSALPGSYGEDIGGFLRHMEWRIQYLESLRGTVAVPLLIMALGHQDPDIRLCAAALLGDVADSRAVECLLPLLCDENPRIRGYAALALGKSGGVAVKEELERLFESEEEPFVKMSAAVCLDRIYTEMGFVGEK